MTQPRPSLSGATVVAGVIGAPIRHTLSPVILNAAFDAAGLDWVYAAFEVAPGHAAAALDAMRTLGLGGLSVTMPHKEAVAAAVDELTEAAHALGAVNCVVPRGGRLLGDNTDGPGFVDALRADHGTDLTDRAVVVVGAGGAARAIIRAAGLAGARAVVVVNRTAARAEVAAALAGAVGAVGSPSAVGEADVVVNATPAGMAGVEFGLAIDGSWFHPGQVVVDVVYHPARTPLLALAEARGAEVSNGLSMLVHQAAHAFAAWTGVKPPVGAMTAAARAAAAAREGSG